MMRPLTIAGGGLAGLSLGIALRLRDVPVTLHEAGAYPRHRVCGEFLSGVSDEVLETLGVDFALVDAVPLRSACWHDATGFLRELEVEGQGISRHLLDDRLQARFRELGGQLVTGSRIAPAEGVIWAAGRPLRHSDWIGLKCHYHNLSVTHDLEMHAGCSGYVGLAQIGSGQVNVCGLFRKTTTGGRSGVDLLLHYLCNSGLEDLACRLERGSADSESFCGVSGLSFRRETDSHFSIGDAAAMIPPFTGNGMSMAFESAFHALEPALKHARGRISWNEAVGAVQQRTERAFRTRLNTARLLHPMIANGRMACWMRRLGMTRWLPMAMIYRIPR